MSSPLARYCLGILKRIYPGHLAHNYPHHLGIHAQDDKGSYLVPVLPSLSRESNFWMHPGRKSSNQMLF